MERVFRALSIAIVVFFVFLGIVIGSRMDQTTIALLGGVLIGLLIAIPFTVLTTIAAMRSRASNLPVEPLAWAPRMPNPYCVVTPPVPPVPTLPQTQSSAAQPFNLPPRRKFYLIGESGDASEIDPSDTSDYSLDQFAQKK